MRSADLSSTWGLAQPPSYKQRQRWAEKWQVKIFLFIRKGEERKVPTETELQPLKVRFGGLLQPFCKFLLVSICLTCLCELPSRKQEPSGWVLGDLFSPGSAVSGRPLSSICSYPGILVGGLSSAPSAHWCPLSSLLFLLEGLFLNDFMSCTGLNFLFYAVHPPDFQLQLKSLY